MKGKEFKYIIFDLGGVIINLDENKTLESFSRISDSSPSVVREFILQFEGYKKFEKGLASDVEFRNQLRDEFQIEATDKQIDDCMNAMLLDIPIERLNLLKSLRASSSLYLLSNTNEIHLKKFNAILKETTGDEKMDVYFNKAYYSHLVKMRKPEKEIFELVLDENNLDPRHTLFLDDNLVNLSGAESVGIKTFHIEHPGQLFQIFT